MKKTIAVSMSAVLFLTGCASYHEVSPGIYEKVTDIQQPSGMGNTISYSKVERCKGDWVYDDMNLKELKFSNCSDVTPYERSSSPGWGVGMLHAMGSGAMNMMGLLGLGMLMKAPNVSQQQSQSVSGSGTTSTTNVTLPNPPVTNPGWIPPGHR
jgi:hypothetical protein